MDVGSIDCAAARPMWKDLTRLLATIVVFGASALMLQRAVGIASPWMVLMLMFCVLGLGKAAEPLYMLKMPGRLRELRAWELRGDVYRSAAVPEFGALLRRTPLRLLNSTLYLSRARHDLATICRQVESAEAIHFWAAIALTPYLVLCVAYGQWALLGCFLVIQILMNVYPIMHLRLVRGRLGRAKRRTSDASTHAFDGQYLRPDLHDPDQVLSRQDAVDANRGGGKR